MSFTELLTLAANTAVTVVNPRKLNAEQRKCYQAGHTTTALLAANTEFSPFKDPRMGRIPRLALNSALAGLTWWATDGRFDHIDEAVEKWFTDHGARYPRYWMAAGSTALLALTFAYDRHTARKELEFAGPISDPAPYIFGEELETVELDDAVRAIIEALIPENDPQFETINDQLDVAQMYKIGRGECQYIGLCVPEDADVDLVVPHTQAWPLRGQFSIGRSTVTIGLDIAGGRLAALWLDAECDENQLPTIDFPALKDWPHPNQLTIIEDAVE